MKSFLLQVGVLTAAVVAFFLLGSEALALSDDPATMVTSHLYHADWSHMLGNFLMLALIVPPLLVTPRVRKTGPYLVGLSLAAALVAVSLLWLFARWTVVDVNGGGRGLSGVVSAAYGVLFVSLVVLVAKDEWKELLGRPSVVLRLAGIVALPFYLLLLGNRIVHLTSFALGMVAALLLLLLCDSLRQKSAATRI